MRVTAVTLGATFACYRPYLDNYEREQEKVKYKSVERPRFSRKLLRGRGGRMPVRGFFIFFKHCKHKVATDPITENVIGII